MHRSLDASILASSISAIVVLTISHVIAAEPLPKSGIIEVHSGYWVVGESVTVAEKHVMGHGSNRGITFNDKGSGPLHLGPTDCFYTFYTAVDRTKGKGYCTFGDNDGDRIFADFSGAFNASGYIEGMHDIEGGTGKYLGIQGKIAFKCKYSGTNGEFECTQRIDYKLP